MTTKNKTKTEPREQMLVITRIFDAPRELVFKAWTDPEMFKRWWGPHGFTTPFCKIDLRSGGVMHTCMRSPEGRDYWSGGVILQVVEPSLLVSSTYFADEKGKRVAPSQYGISDDFPSESQMTVTFVDLGGRTKLTMEQDVPLSVAERNGAPEGWNQSFDRLSAYFAKL